MVVYLEKDRGLMRDRVELGWSLICECFLVSLEAPAKKEPS